MPTWRFSQTAKVGRCPDSGPRDKSAGVSSAPGPYQQEAHQMPGSDAPSTSERTPLRDRRLAGDEEQRLLASLKACGTYFAPLAELALETAMRQSELLSLTSASVDFGRGLAHVRDPDETKGRTVPLSPRAAEIISALPKPVSLVSPLFPISRDELIRVFRRACNAAGIRDLKFQDLRHEAICRMSGRMSMEETMRVVGYKTPAMLMRYYAASDPLHSATNAELPALAATRTVRILVVEDNRDAAHMLAQFLRLSGYAVTVAYTSGEGLEAARKTPPDVVLCDIGLTGRRWLQPRSGVTGEPTNRQRSTDCCNGAKSRGGQTALPRGR